ncbi:hypothetical protein MMC17_006008 [Xylographa soralifera]|nr:hypothetical protein [Xylographa soralifera]
MKLPALVFGVFAGIAFSHPIGSDNYTLNTTTLQSREILAGTKSLFTISTYPEPNCRGIEIPFMNPNYSDDEMAEVYSYKLNRDLDPSEQLDFSFNNCVYGTTLNVCVPCGEYYSSAWKGAPAGVCFDLGKRADCFRLWHH